MNPELGDFFSDDDDDDGEEFRVVLKIAVWTTKINRREVAKFQQAALVPTWIREGKWPL